MLLTIGLKKLIAVVYVAFSAGFITAKNEKRIKRFVRRKLERANGASEY